MDKLKAVLAFIVGIPGWIKANPVYAACIGAFGFVAIMAMLRGLKDMF